MFGVNKSKDVNKSKERKHSMKEFVFSFKDNSGKHIARFDGNDENEAFEQLKQMFPDAQKLAAFPMDDTLAKILDAVKQVPSADLEDAATNQQHTSATDAIAQHKADIESFRRQKTAEAIAKKTLDKGEMEQSDWNTICGSLTPEEKKELYDEFIADADKNHADKNAAKLEKKFVNYIFGVKEKGKWTSDNLTVRDLASAFGISHVRVLAIQKQALAKIVNNIAKMKRYPFKITTAEEAIALLMADNIVNPEDLKLKVKVNGGMSFEQALKTMVKMEKAAKAAKKAKLKADTQAHRKAMAEFRQLEKETNQLRDKLGLPRQYEKFFKFFVGQKLGNWA